MLSSTKLLPDALIVISVLIPTFHRPHGALAAVRSVFAQDGAPEYEVVLVDNDKEKSSKSVAELLATEANVPFHYVVEAAAGVANARNTAVKHARGKFVAFLDDDEVATPQWLAKLFAAYEHTKADVVFGPIEARLPPDAAEPLDFFQTYFSRLLDGETRLIDTPYGCGNSLLCVDTVLSALDPFKLETNETGGEDDLLWHDVRMNGGTFGWASDAWVYEDVPSNRASWTYLSKRSFAYGHNTTAQWFNRTDRSLSRTGFSMVKGLIQFCAMVPVTIFLVSIRHRKRAWVFDKMMQGLGKLLWFGPFRVGLYGMAAQKTTAATTQKVSS